MKKKEALASFFCALMQALSCRMLRKLFSIVNALYANELVT